MAPGANRTVLALVALVAAGLGVYSQTRAFAWDEGFHLLTAQLIGRGERPYLDFCFSQTPLNAYWNAGWMRVFGDTWRTAHAVAAAMTSLAVLLTAGCLLRRFPEPGWRLGTAVSAAFLVGLNIAVVEFGAVGQAYGLCLFLLVSAFLCTVAAAGRAGIAAPAGAGFLACAAANASLLTAPAAPVLLVWLWFSNRAGNRWTKSAAFAGAGAVAFGPLAWLFVQGPRQTIFNVLEYNMLYRQRNWAGAAQHNIDQLTAWIDSPQALMLGLLALGGLAYVWKGSGWERAQRREFYLCGWLALGLMAHISTAIPTFTRYYLLAAPFLAILAGAGVYAAGARLAAPDRPFWPVLTVCVISGLCLARALYEGRDDYTWYDAEKTAAKVNEVTPPRAVLLADELIYFVTRHAPPPGMELADSHKLNFPPAVAAELHVVPQAELDRRVKAGVYDTVESADDDLIDKWGLQRLYAHSAEVGDAHVFWGRAGR